MTTQALDDLDEETRKQLLEYRQHIDRLDDQIIELMTQRCAIVRQVGKLKKQSYNPSCYIRAAREAEMLRDITAKFASSGFSPVAAAAIWRNIIAASTAMESPFTFSVLADKTSVDLYWLTREYFGNFSPITSHNSARLVISDLLEDKATIGILPMPSAEEPGDWWNLLLEGSARDIKIFACLPFVITTYDKFTTPPAVALARIRPEMSGKDRSFMVLRANEGISQNRLNDFFADGSNDNISAEWINISAPEAGLRYHLLALNRFIDSDDGIISKLIAEYGSDNLTPILLGSYAEPIYIPQNTVQIMEAQNDGTNGK